MTFQLKIDCDNAAFEDPAELPRILTDLAGWLANCGSLWVQGTVRDVNGNTVGSWER